MPTTYIPLRWYDLKDHVYRIATTINMLLQGAHNDVYDLTVEAAHVLTRFPSSAQVATILSFANLGGSPNEIRATCAAGHGLVEGDIAVISTSTNFDGSYTITNVDAATTFDFEHANAATSGGWLNQGFVNERVTPETVPVLVPTNSAAGTLMYSGAFMLHTSNVGYIDFNHDTTAGDKTFKLLLFGD